MREARPEGTAIRLDGIGKHYGPTRALTGVDLSVPSGELIALLGPNGAGKTTLVSLILGLLRPDAGAIEVLGDRPGNPAGRQRVGAMLQISGVPANMTVREHLTLFSTYYTTSRCVDEQLDIAGLSALADRRYEALSGGQRQRLMFALADCGRPELLVLDEPTVGMDPQARRDFWATIRQRQAQGCTVVLTTHALEEADSVADRVAVLHRGELVADGTPAAIKSRVATSRIRCRSAVPTHEVAALDGVADCQRNGGELIVHARHAEPVVGELLRRDPGLTGLEVTAAGLEEAFLALTHDRPEEVAV